MSTHAVASALARLRVAADIVNKGWAPSDWRIIDEAGAETAFHRAFSPGAISWDVGGIGELDLTPGTRVTLRTTLEPPVALHGVDLTGDRLEATVKSLYPIEVLIDGQMTLSESIPPVAAGPALLTVDNSIEPGRGRELEITIRPLEGQRGGGVTWLDMVFTTPGLRRRFDVLDLAWARLSLANEVAGAHAQRAAVEAAADLVPEDLLDLTHEDLSSALEQMALALRPLAASIAAVDVHVIGHAHIDLAWLWTWNYTREVIKRDIRTVLSIMSDYPEATFTHSQPAGYEVIRTEEPQMFQEVRRLIDEGRWEPATAQWVEGDTNLASGEAMVSQLLEGVSFSREHLGVTPRVFLAPDTFGHSANMPQLVTTAGAKVYYHMRCNPGSAQGRMWPAYWWEGADGTRILAVSTTSYSGHPTAGSIAGAAIDALRAGLQTALLFIGVGDHGGGPTRLGYDTLRSVGAAEGMPSARCSTIAAYADQVLGSGVDLPVHRGESARIFEGCYTTHAEGKQANRYAENQLSTAESLAALAGLSRPAELTDAWRRVCFNQFHDIIAGSAVPDVYDMAMDDYASVASSTDDVIDRSLEVLTANNAVGAITVANPHGHACEDVVSVPFAGTGPVALVDENGDVTPGQVNDGRLFFVARVPAFGAASYRALEGQSVTVAGFSEPTDDLEYIRLRTSQYNVTVRKDCGIIVSLIDLRTGADLVAYGTRRATDYGDSARPDLGLNVFQIADERPHFMSAWQYQEVHAEHSLIDGASTEVVEVGPVRTVLRVTHRFRSSQIVEDIVFYRDLPRIDFIVNVDWQEEGGHDTGIPNLKLGFTPDIDVAEAWFEVPHAAVRRRPNGQQVPTLRWADVGDASYGVTVLNDSSYAYDVMGSRVRVGLLRTAYMPDARSDRGAHTFRFGLLPHLGDWREARVPHAAALFNQPLIARVRGGESAATALEPVLWRPDIQVEDGLVSTVLRIARDGRGTVLRLAEVSGRSASVVVASTHADAPIRQSDIVERRGRVLSAGPDLRLQLRPWEVRTILVDAAGAEAEASELVTGQVL